MIKTLECEETARIFKRNFPGKLPRDSQRLALQAVDVGYRTRFEYDLNSLRVPPANRLEEALHVEGEGQYRIRINEQRLICFGWQDGNAFEVEISDSH